MYRKSTLVNLALKLNCNYSNNHCIINFKKKNSYNQNYRQISTSYGRFKDFISEFEDDPTSPSHSYAPYASDLFPLCTVMPKRVKVIICGGGIFGTSLAYHLGNMNWGKDTLLIDQGRLGGPTSWRGSGVLGSVKFSFPEMKILQSSLQLVQSLDAQGYNVGWKQCGSLHLARTSQRLTHFRKIKAIAEARGTECYILTPAEVARKCHILNTEDLEGAFWVPGDGICDLYRLCITLIQQSQQKGVQIVENCSLRRIITQDERVVAVETSKGLVECDIFVNAAGTWARQVGMMTEPYVKVPIHPAEHYYLYTNPLEGVNLEVPAIRDPDGFIYMREYNGGILAGTFEEKTKPAFENGVFPEKWYLREQDVDWDQFHPALQEILHRVPFLQNAIINRLHNSIDAFSPDNRWIIGSVPEFRNYFVAAGMKSGGSNAGSGLGQLMAEWVIHSHPPFDVYLLDILRFLPGHNNRKFLRDRVVEVPGMHYNLEFPFADFKTGRCIRMSPIFPKLKAAGGVFGQVMGYERPSYFITDGSLKEEEGEVPFRAAVTNTWTKPPWFDYTAAEYQACRETCGLLDYSSFAKFDIWSKEEEVVDALQYLCSNDVNIPVGGICHSGMQNKFGGYENDCSLARISRNHFMMIAPSIQQTRCLTWLRKNLPSDGSVIISDITSKYTAICLMGPKARTILSKVTDCDLAPKAFPFFSFKEIDIGLANGIRAMNLTHTGELGWVLYIPNEYALHVYDNLVSVGTKHGLMHAGYYAMRALRVEKFFAFWGQDLDSTTTPLECGRVFRTKLDKNIDFMGREALEKQRKEGVKRMYVHLALDDHDAEIDPWPWGGEPIYRNGRFVGITTTTSYGYTLQKIVCLGFIRNVTDCGVHETVTSEYVMDGEYEVDIAGIKFSAKVNLRSPTLPSKFPETQKGRYLATQT